MKFSEGYDGPSIQSRLGGLMKKILAILTLSLTTSAFAADLTLNIHNTITLKKVAKDTYEKINQVVVTDRNLVVNGQAKKDSKKAVNAERMIYTLDQNLLRIQDDKELVDTEMGVTADRNLFGKLKSFTISGDKLAKAYEDSNTRKGITSLAALDTKSASRKSLVVGNQVCVVDSKSSDLLKCEQSTTLNVTNNGAILKGALFIFETEI